jgi:dephospho-CoA kinase
MQGNLNLIGISGKAGSGKDEFVDVLNSICNEQGYPTYKNK